MQYSTTNYMGTSTRVFIVRQSKWRMVCLAPIAPSVTMVGVLCSGPQTCARNFPASSWLFLMSWCAVLGDCGRFSWLRSELCFTSPKALGGN